MEGSHVVLIDTHAHLEEIKDLDEALSKARSVEVVAVITMGSDYRSSLWAIRNCGEHVSGLRVYPALGVHPWSAGSLNTEEMNALLELMHENVENFVAVGEVGLDYWYKEVRRDPGKRGAQKAIFKEMLRVAVEYGKPVSVHSRGAWRDCLNIVAESGVESAIFHWFSGSLEVLKEIIDRGYLISATPAAAYSREHRLAIESTPLENIVLETDSPVTYRGETAEPAHVTRTLRAVAQIKGLDEASVEDRTTKNARNIFRI
ncbi:MAG: Mg-dependent DNase [Candidatus Bathyarchaeota archaeon B26-2]|nr:MAG: Mg-dependent DNase [Candidatus Bathyarchaeota archaeon B26-2]